MKSYQKEFIQLALKHQALKFGEFKLKSGRISPYFFNAGQFQTGQALADLGRLYSAAIVESAVEFDMLFGPAYKGIPLVSTTAIALADHYQRDLPYAFNRKEAKTHGEGGDIVGAPLKGRVVIVDDVITAGTAIREVLMLLNAAQAIPSAIIVGLDRQEKGASDKSAIQELFDTTGIKVFSLIQLDTILVYLAQQGLREWVSKISQYRETYGV